MEKDKDSHKVMLGKIAEISVLSVFAEIYIYNFISPL